MGFQGVRDRHVMGRAISCIEHSRWAKHDRREQVLALSSPEREHVVIQASIYSTTSLLSCTILLALLASLTRPMSIRCSSFIDQEQFPIGQLPNPESKKPLRRYTPPVAGWVSV